MRQRIVIVGGGTGGTILANVLAEKLHREIINNKVELLMISDSPLHYYKPAFMYVAFNTFFKQELTRSQRSLLRPEIQFIVDKAESFDLTQRNIATQSGKIYSYDFLVFATGCVPGRSVSKGWRRRAIIFTSIRPPGGWRKNWRLSRKGVSSSPFPSLKPPTCPTSAASRRSKPP